jgi:uncharacterized protein (UPF0333 family)
VGAFAAFSSWSFYGAGAAIAQSTERGQISLRFSALAGALIVGVAGAKWITNQVDKQLLKEGIKSASAATGRAEDHHRLIKGSARRVLRRVKHAQ